MSTYRDIVIRESQFIRDATLRLVAAGLGRDHIWNDELAAIEDDNYATDDELRGIPTRERVQEQGGRTARTSRLNAPTGKQGSTLSAAVVTHDKHIDRVLGCPGCDQQEFVTHNHNDDPWDEGDDWTMGTR